MTRMTRILVCAVAAACLGASTAAGGTAPATRAAAACTAAQLRGSFSVIRGSAGAGNISYALVLRNVSQQACTVTGLPSVTLLGKTGRKLPTHVWAEFPGALSAVLVTLAPGSAARATARFSPDVPGVGEGGRSRCEPVAYRLRVRGPGGGTLTAPVTPPTSVCEHGRLLFRAYGFA